MRGVLVLAPCHSLFRANQAAIQKETGLKAHFVDDAQRIMGLDPKEWQVVGIGDYSLHPRMPEILEYLRVEGFTISRLTR